MKRLLHLVARGACCGSSSLILLDHFVFNKITRSAFVALLKRPLTICGNGPVEAPAAPASGVVRFNDAHKTNMPKVPGPTSRHVVCDENVRDVAKVDGEAGATGLQRGRAPGT